MRLVLPLCLLLAGCDVLFPELSGTPPATDGGVADAGAPPHIAGAVCALGDVRDYRTCGLGPAGSFRITVEETRDAAQADTNGVFNVATMGALASATLSVVDASNRFVPTITVVHPTNGVLDNYAVPMVTASDEQQMALTAGFSVDPTRGGLLAWAVDTAGAPIPGVRSTAVTGAIGPLYDGAANGQLVATQATGSRGLIAHFDLPPGTTTLQLTTATGTTTFTFPIRAGAITLMALTIP
jgi:hypothetical protein